MQKSKVRCICFILGSFARCQCNGGGGGGSVGCGNKAVISLTMTIEPGKRGQALKSMVKTGRSRASTSKEK